jgi:hypothetical protein
VRRRLSAVGYQLSARLIDLATIVLRDAYSHLLT